MLITCADIWLLHVMYIHKLYPTHMWYKNLASILAASGSLTKLVFLQNLRLRESSPNQNWRQHGARGPGPATYNIRRVFDDPGAQRLESHRFCRGRSRPWFATTKSPSQRLQLERHLCQQWFAGQRCNREIQGVFFRHPESTRNPRRLETHLGARVQSEDGSIFSGVPDHESLVGRCQLVSY